MKKKSYTYLSLCTTKPTKWPVRPAKTQISLGIGPVWSESSLSAWRNLGSLATHWTHSEDWLDWVVAQADLSLHWVHRLFCWFCCAQAHFCRSSKTTYGAWRFKRVTWIMLWKLSGHSLYSTIKQAKNHLWENNLMNCRMNYSTIFYICRSREITYVTWRFRRMTWTTLWKLSGQIFRNSEMTLRLKMKFCR